ncbi:E3 ubiquitin-protein ligase RMA3-like [Wolffia australiana]
MERESGGESKVQTASACFDCNICLEFAVEPVVTLCGHLYCWPCIYKWLQPRSEREAHEECPVCKAALSPAALVPLYGRGCSKPVARSPAVPRRPPAHAAARPRPGIAYDRDLAAPAAHPPLLGGTAVAVLPWVLGEDWVALFHAYPHQLLGDGHGLRGAEMRARTSLHRVSLFFFVCVLLCLLLF